ncbi:D-alanyl-D-alanine carboxypeptidase family protein [Steroidobacter sp.]|uniref:D-alanyl-D-alanine carboxypeptidase family protein n=1 Tax=Steroidobacter sp. TaxID=1978227 RepID=UPI001A440AD9|nr:D-alanyl-D-alanine carboxypeptidase family protein [Steroidobacter sp.]MBL8269094.1 D-alanyl-D-alanine carboxypeptidase [Steroidobacter sp.]
MPVSTPTSLLKFTAPLVLALTLIACSDSEPPAAERSIAAPLPDVTKLANASDTKPPPIPAPPQVQARGYILLDYSSNQPLAASNENERLEPASLTKLMSAYAVFHALKDGRIKLTDLVTISQHARSQDGSRMFVHVGTQVSVENLIQGMIVQSGNDATVALAEHVAGSEPVFVDLMNQYAQQLGMVSTRFQNSPGMPHPEHYTTARDIAVLSSALIKEYPDYYKWYSQRSFTWNKITQPNRNGLLDRDASVDGLKTGHTESAGYCLVSSAHREGMRLVSVVMGSPSVRAREDASAALLNYGFNFYQTRKLYANKAPVMTVKVWKGEDEEVPLGVAQDIYATVPRGQENLLSAAADVTDPLFAPLSPDKAAGQLRITLGDKVIGTYPLHPTKEVPEAGFFGRLSDDVKLWFN